MQITEQQQTKEGEGGVDDKAMPVAAKGQNGNNNNNLDVSATIEETPDENPTIEEEGEAKSDSLPSAAPPAAAPTTAAGVAAASVAAASEASSLSVVASSVTPTSPRSMTTASMSASGE